MACRTKTSWRAITGDLMINVRNLRADEPHPEGFATGYENMPIDREWVWVAEQNGKIVGILLVGACHGMVYVMRLVTLKGTNPVVIRVLLDKSRKDCADRGFKGYFFHVDPTMKMDRKILRHCKKDGGIQMMIPQVMLVGSLERPCRHS